MTKKVQERRLNIWACDGKRGALLRKEGDGNGSSREKEVRKAQEKMVGSVRDDIRGKGLSRRKWMT